MPGQNFYKKNNNTFKEILLSYLRRPEKFFLVFFIAGLLTLGFGIWYSRNTIRKPFIVASQTPTDNSQDQETLAGFTELLNNQQKDTDGDGLSDNFETNIYSTSPYLQDSDSDGIDDKIEITNGTNPNCAEGTDCSVIAPTATIDPNNLLVDFAGGVITDEYAASLRQVLLQVGIDAETLDNMSNQELVDLYNKTITELQTQPSKEKDLVSGNLNPNALRELLLEGGIDQDTLNKISDEELLQVYDEVLAQEYANQLTQ